MRTNRGELDAAEARSFFERHGVRLRLITAYNLKLTARVSKGILQSSMHLFSLVNACKGKLKQWPRLLPFVLWAEKTIYNTVTKDMPIELMLG
jgi:hypothetical protein